MSKKETSDKCSTLASNVLSGRVTPTQRQARQLAASVLSQDEHRGKRPQPTHKKR